MAEQTTWSSDAPKKANHLCIFVHGLWGNPTHMKTIHDGLRAEYDEDRLVILMCQRNVGSFTYDGIEVGAERVTREVEETLEELSRNGHNITRLSVVGYSLGGLVARYVVGLLYHKGYFEKITPANFTTFATPHLGVRTPLRGYANKVWNFFGSITLATAGRQLYTIDNYRDTGRPLLDVMADPDSIFIHALAKFQRKILYTNVVNDRAVTYYTSSISRIDPYSRISELDMHYVKGYEPVIVDPEHPFDVVTNHDLPSFYARFTGGSQSFFKNVPFYLTLVFVVPIATVAFFINASIQTLRSQRRIQLHQRDAEGRGYGAYRIPYMIQDMRAGLEDAFEHVNSAQRQEYLPEGTEEVIDGELSTTSPRQSFTQSSINEKVDVPLLRKTTSRSAEFPTLALTTAQFGMIKGLNDVGWRKYPVYIHKTWHSHAAIIKRTNRVGDEGDVVIKHWLKEEFKI